MRLTALAAVSTLVLAACSDSPTAPHHDSEPVAAEVYERGTENRLAYVHGDHWHGGIELTLGQEIEVDVRFLDENDQVIELGGEYTVQAEIAAGHPAGLIDVHGHGDHLDIESEAPGETRILIHFWHDGHADWTTPPLRVTVHAGELAGAEVYMRGTEDRLAYVHELPVGEEIEVDVRFLNEHDAVIPLGGEYTVEAEIAPEHPSHVIHVHGHGDHLDIEGEEAGETRVLIHLWHDDHADWTTPPLRVTVTD